MYFPPYLVGLKISDWTVAMAVTICQRGTLETVSFRHTYSSLQSAGQCMAVKPAGGTDKQGDMSVLQFIIASCKDVELDYGKAHT